MLYAHQKKPHSSEVLGFDQMKFYGPRQVPYIIYPMKTAKVTLAKLWS